MGGGEATGGGSVLPENVPGEGETCERSDGLNVRFCDGGVVDCPADGGSGRATPGTISCRGADGAGDGGVEAGGVVGGREEGD